MKYLVWIALVVVPTSAIFFGGGGGGCGGGCSSCCPPPPPPCAAPQPCAAPPPCAPPPPPQPCGCGGGGYSGGFGGGYAQAPVPTCRPRYIIVRPVESSYGGGGYSGGGYSGGGGGYASAPQSYSAPIPQASYSAGPVAQASYSAGPVAQASYSAPQAAPVVQASYSAPQAAPVVQASYSAPQAAPVAASYASGGSSYAASKARASKTLSVDAHCNSQELKVILETAMVAGDANESKRRVHSTANEQFSTENNQKGLDVICAPSKISYRIATDLFCEHTKGDVTCFVYQQSS